MKNIDELAEAAENGSKTETDAGNESMLFSASE